MHERTILTFISAFLPGYRLGGPTQSVANLVERLGERFRFRIVTTDRDVGDTAPYAGITPMRWHRLGRGEVLYAPPGALGPGACRRLLDEEKPALLYLNSFFDPRFTTLPLLARRMSRARRTPVLLAPRGEFSQGALTLKAGRKRLFLAAAKAVRLHDGVQWQATSPQEEEDIRREMPGADLRLMPNLPRAPQPVARAPRAAGAPLRLVFLSRISPKKNLLFALEVLARVSIPVDFTILGPHEDAAYWARCERAIAALPAHVRVTDGGPVEPARVVPALAAHDLFFLPTLGENYGHVIAEALEAGLRLLLSDRTPWRDLARAGVGHDLPLSDPGAFARAIEAEGALQADAAMGERIARYREGALRVEAAVATNLRHLDEAVAAG